MPKQIRLALILAGLLLAPALALAHSYVHGDLALGHAWAKPGGSAAWLPIVNRGSETDRLLGGATPAAEAIVLRSRGETVEAFELAPGRPLAMREGAREIGLTGLKAPLREGDKFPLTLRFEHAGDVTIEVWVEAQPGAH